jgi:hypothetical protein
VAFEKLNREEDLGKTGSTGAAPRHLRFPFLALLLWQAARVPVFQTVSLQKQKLLFTYVFDPRFFYKILRWTLVPNNSL